MGEDSPVLKEQNNFPQCKTAANLNTTLATVYYSLKRFQEYGEISVCMVQGWKSSLIFGPSDCTALKTGMVLSGKSLHGLSNTVCEHSSLCVPKYSSIIANKSFVNTIQKHRYLFWAKTYLKWTESKTNTVLWSDRSKFEFLFVKHGHLILQT